MEQNQIAAQLAFNNNKKHPAVAWILWFLIWGFGAHRFYLGQTVRGILILAIAVPVALIGFGLGLIPVVGLIFDVVTAVFLLGWWAYEAIVLNHNIQKANQRIWDQISAQFGLSDAPKNAQPAQQQAIAAPAGPPAIEAQALPYGSGSQSQPYPPQ